MANYAHTGRADDEGLQPATCSRPVAKLGSMAGPRTLPPNLRYRIRRYSADFIESAQTAVLRGHSKQKRPRKAAFNFLNLFRKIWSGRRDSNPRPQPWQGCALPLSYARAPPRLMQRPARIITGHGGFARLVGVTTARSCMRKGRRSMRAPGQAAARSRPGRCRLQGSSRAAARADRSAMRAGTSAR